MMASRVRRYTRFVKKAVCQEVLWQSRNRCCVSGCRSRVLLPGQVTNDLISRILHKHHLIFYSDGGPPTAENLILVCPNCHAAIHKFPAEFPIERLKKDKAHWIGMQDVVPRQLLVALDTSDQKAIQPVAIPISLESVNLRFELLASPHVRLADIMVTIAESILRPLGEYDSNPEWINPDVVALARRSDPHVYLDLKLPVSALDLPPDDPLIAVIHVSAVPAIGHERFSATAVPLHPSPRQLYSVKTQLRFEQQGIHVAATVRGTDGYSAESAGQTGPDGSFVFFVPGAQSGTIDTVDIRVMDERKSLTIVFGDWRHAGATILPN